MPKPIVILGCTAAGKSDLAEGIAQRLGAEVLAVDSMQVYRGMDIGTAKPSAETRARISYLMLDLCDPWEVFSAAKFVETARPIVEDRVRSGKPLVIVAGTILYLRSLIEGLFEGPGRRNNPRRARRRAAAEGTAPLHVELAKIDPIAATRIHPNDQRRIIRALEVFRLTGTPISTLQTQWSAAHPPTPPSTPPILASKRDKDLLNRRINARVKKMLEAGLVEEVRRLAGDPRGFSEEASSGVGYRQLLDYFAGKCTLEEAIELIKIQTRYLAKMQRTWLKRWPPPGAVRWLPAAENEEGRAGRAGPFGRENRLI